ncbi:FHA domain-containing protein [Leptolyngbya sp. AN02str]|uniref:FHA domain-containing protein n=1 Tax=Leptolyngbya sp. AN02str TaxID=3423363 RepID=UPI003D321782
MLNLNALSAYSSKSLDNATNAELQQQLGLYRVFLRLYEHNRGLLDEILSLENISCKDLAGVSLPYVQGIAIGRQVYLMTNLLGGTTRALTQPQYMWTIGRDARQAVLPVQDQRLSRRHAAIRYENQGFYLVDIGSRNGSFVNGEPIRQPRLLKDGDRVRLGSLTFVFFVCSEVQQLCNLPPEMAALVNGTAKTAETLQEDPTAPLQDDDEMTMLMPPITSPAGSEAPTVYSPEDTLTFLRTMNGDCERKPNVSDP